MSSQDWRARLPGAPITPTGALADPPLKRVGRQRKTSRERTATAKAAARAHVNAEIQRVAAERARRPFTVTSSLARVSGANGYQTTAEALIAAGAEDDRDTPTGPSTRSGALESVPPTDPTRTEVAQSGTLSDGADGPQHVGQGTRGPIPAHQRLGGRIQGVPIAIPFAAAEGASPLPHTELAPAPGGGIRVRTGEDADEALVKYIHGMMLTSVWTDRMVDSLASEHHRAAHAVRMLANRAASRMDATLYVPSIHESIYRRTRLVADIALDGAVSVREPAYIAAACKALECEAKAAGLLPKDTPAAKTPAELKVALRAALARVEAMDVQGEGGVATPSAGDGRAAPHQPT